MRLEFSFIYKYIYKGISLKQIKHAATVILQVEDPRKLNINSKQVGSNIKPRDPSVVSDHRSINVLHSKSGKCLLEFFLTNELLCCVHESDKSEPKCTAASLSAFLFFFLALDSRNTDPDGPKLEHKRV